MKLRVTFVETIRTYYSPSLCRAIDSLHFSTRRYPAGNKYELSKDSTQNLSSSTVGEIKK